MLFYCGFESASHWVWEQAEYWSTLAMDTALYYVRGFMEATVPVIGGVTIYMQRTSNHKKRHLTIEEVIESPSPFPLLLVPEPKFGVVNNAICIVDDLVFDSITNKALRLCNETFLWIFNDEPITLLRAYHFNVNRTRKNQRSSYV